jgi:hypothetical protein
MSTFTGRELEFLAGLDRRWWTLYWRELARLLRGASTAPDTPYEADAAARSRGSRGPTAKILVLAPEFRGCGDETACPFRQRRHARDDGAGPLVAAPR